MAALSESHPHGRHGSELFVLGATGACLEATCAVLAFLPQVGTGCGALKGRGIGWVWESVVRRRAVKGVVKQDEELLVAYEQCSTHTCLPIHQAPKHWLAVQISEEDRELLEGLLPVFVQYLLHATDFEAAATEATNWASLLPLRLMNAHSASWRPSRC